MVEIVVFERGVGHFQRKFQRGNGCPPPTIIGIRKLLRVPGLSYGEEKLPKISTG